MKFSNYFNDHRSEETVISLKDSITFIFYVNSFLLCISFCSCAADNLKWLFEMHLKLFFMLTLAHILGCNLGNI